MAFQAALLGNRARFNAKFAEARHYQPKLDGDAFADLLHSLVAPIVEAVHQTNPDSTYIVTESLYDIALDLLAQDLLGPQTRHPVLASGWTYLLPKLARFIAADPRTVIAAVTNALYNLALAPGARPGEWMRDLIAPADHCPDVETLLKVGQILAWKSGLAHYRASALDRLQTLPPALARLSLALPADDPQPLDSIISRLRADSWSRPTLHASHSTPQLQIVKRVGAFRGFGGLFLVPPIVEPAGDHFLVTDGEGTWRLTADLFGATFHRSTHSDSHSNSHSNSFTLSRSGEVKTPNAKRHFPELAQSTSHAANLTTLAVTVPYSHAIYLIAFVSA